MHGRSGKEWCGHCWCGTGIFSVSDIILTIFVQRILHILPISVQAIFPQYPNTVWNSNIFQYNGFYSPNIQVQNSSFWNKGKYFTFECWENIICMTGKNMEVGLWLYVSGILSFHILDMDRLDLKCFFLWQ